MRLAPTNSSVGHRCSSPRHPWPENRQRMILNPSDVPAPYDFAGGVIRVETDKLARRYGLETERVCRILTRTATDSHGRPLPPAVAGQDNLSDGLLFRPSLDDALRYLPPEDALALFEREDLRRLDDRESVTSYLDDHLGFFTTEELGDLADAFADHLEDNRRHLASTGLPRTAFGLRWPGPYLRDLYPVKTFYGCQTTYYVDGQEIPLTYPLLYGRDPTTSVTRVRSYTWRRLPDPILGTDKPPGSITQEALWDDAGWVPCTYEEAPLTYGLDASDAARLEAGRPAMLDLEIRVLRRLALALRARNASDLWSDCLRLLTDALLADDAAFYLRIDRFLNSYDVRTGETTEEGDPDFAPGGLTNLLEVIGDCEKELTIGTMDRTKRALPPEAALDSLRSYYEAIGQPWQGRFDAALDLFIELDAREAAFRDAFRTRVNEALETEFYAEVIVRTRVKQKLAATFEPYLRGFAEWQRANLETTGTLSPLHLSPPVVLPDLPPNVFRRDGDGWTIAYAEHTAHLKDAKGLYYLAYLLRHPGREFHVLDLVAAVEGRPFASANALDGMSKEDLANQGMSVSGLGDVGELLDQQAKMEIGERLRQLEQDLQEALALGQTDTAEAVRTEREDIARYVAGAVGLRGRNRPAASANERVRVNVRRLISRALDQIAEHHQPLRVHLQSIRTGRFCSYDPPSGETCDWDL